MFLSLALTAKGSVDASPLLWTGALAALSAAALMLPDGVFRRQSGLSIAVFGFAFWLTATNLWSNPSYTAAAPFHAAFLAGGFLFGRRAGARADRQVFAATLAFAATLSLWALWQQIDGAARSRAVFETPATLAACINLVLVPGLVLLAADRLRLALAPVFALLAAALLATEGRGGWLALAASLILAFGLLRLSGQTLRPRHYGVVAAVFAGGAILFWLAIAAREWINIAPHVYSYSLVGPEAAGSSRGRIALYELAWRAVTVSSPWLGSGYLGFYYVVEAANPPLRGYPNTPFFFVHNDYLQTLLELGIPGLLGMLLLATLPLVVAWRRRSVNPARTIALAAATASMALHAVVDFPFYVPICLLAYGVVLGLLDSTRDEVTATDAAPPPFQRGLVAAVATLFAWTLLRPAAAEACALRANQQWRGAHAENAAFWFELARRIDPADWRYHWYAGQFWFTQARVAANTAAADHAEAAFAAGVTANPREVKNVLARLATQRRMRGILSAPASERTLQDWAAQAIRLAPHDPSVRATLAALDVKPREGQ